MIKARREQLDPLTVDNARHPGLWLERYLDKHLERDKKLSRDEKSPYVTHIEETIKVLNSMDSALYQSFFTRWTNALAAHGAVCREAHVLGRMVIGLGDEAVLETAITLHHTYGVPVIPGSALKGLAGAFVRQRLDDQAWGRWAQEGERRFWAPGEAYRTLFGDTEHAGYITFFDALYIPGNSHPNRPLCPDVITVHHRDYYQGKGKPPADWDSPTPIPFLSATGAYLVALAGDARWVATAFEILRHALRDMGVGAKTSSGYGRLDLKEPSSQTAAPAAPAAAARKGGETAIKLPDRAEQQVYAEKVFAQWHNQSLQVRFVELADDGALAQPKDPKHAKVRGFVPTDQIQGRAIDFGSDRNCIVRSLIERNGEWLLLLDWPKKKGR